MTPAWLIQYQQLLSLQLQQGSLPHALLFCGVEGCGKSVLADWFIQISLCSHLSVNADNVLQPCLQCKFCQLYLAGNFPDHLKVVSEKTTIGVDEIRHANQFLQKTAQMSGRKTVLIPQAQTMTESAANALLKTLEEPSQHSHIVLLSSDPERLLPTIISRCRVISIRPFVGKQLASELSLSEPLSGNSAQNDAFHNLSHLAELSSEEVHREYLSFTDLLSQYLAGQVARTALLATLVNHPHGMRWLEKALINFMRHFKQWPIAITANTLNILSASEIKYDDIYQCYKIFLQSQQQLVNLVQANKNFIVEKMLIDMQKQINSRAKTN